MEVLDVLQKRVRGTTTGVKELGAENLATKAIITSSTRDYRF